MIEPKQRIESESIPDLSRKSRVRVIPPLPTILTLGNLFCGLLVIIYCAEAVFRVERDFAFATERIKLAGFLLFLSMFFDALDGRVARITGQVSRFGGQLDSLADMVTFGVAPAILTKALSEQMLGAVGRQLALWFCIFYVLCAALRLARYHVEHDQQEGGHETFLGLPSPGAAGLVAGAAVFFGRFPGWEGSRHLVASLPFALPVLSILMISRIPYPHLMNVFFRDAKPLKYFVLLGFLATVAVVIDSVEAVLAGLAVIYVLTGPARFSGRLLSGRAAKSELEIFD